MSAHHQRAWAALAHARWDLAEREWRLTLIEAPDDATAHAGLAIALTEQQHFEEAQREADAAVGLAPEVDFTHQVRARVLRDRRHFGEARTAVEEAIRLNPEDPNHYCVLASIQLQQQRWTECLAAADAGLALAPEHDGNTNLRALALTHLGRKDEAAATIAGALQRAPENSLTHTNQGWALLHRNEPKAALEHFREALRLDPTNDWAREGLLTALKAKNRVFRLLLAYFLFMSRQRGGVRWAIILSILFGQRLLRGVASSHPEWGIVIYPLIALVAVFIYSTWLANPLMNLVMRFDRFGKHALTPDQFTQANLIGVCLFATASLFGIELWLHLGHVPSLMLLLLTIPLTSIHDSAAGWPRRTSLIVTTALGVIAVFEIFVIHVLHLDLIRSQIGAHVELIANLASLLLPVYFLGVLGWSLLAMAWIERAQPRR